MKHFSSEERRRGREAFADGEDRERLLLQTRSAMHQAADACCRLSCLSGDREPVTAALIAVNERERERERGKDGVSK